MAAQLEPGLPPQAGTCSTSTSPSSRSTAERLEDRERHDVARAALARLGDDCRQLVRLLTVEDLTYRDIEEMPGWAEGGVAIPQVGACWSSCGGRRR